MSGNPTQIYTVYFLGLIHSYVPSIFCIVWVRKRASTISCRFLALICAKYTVLSIHQEACHSHFLHIPSHNIHVPRILCVVCIEHPLSTKHSSMQFLALIHTFVPSILCKGCLRYPNANMHSLIHSSNTLICAKYALLSMHRETRHYHFLHIPHPNTLIATTYSLPSVHWKTCH
jgi:hypothetical protein